MRGVSRGPMVLVVLSWMLAKGVSKAAGQWLGIGTLGSASHGVLASHSSLGAEAGAELSTRSRVACAKVAMSYRTVGNHKGVGELGLDVAPGQW